MAAYKFHKFLQVAITYHDEIFTAIYDSIAFHGNDMIEIHNIGSVNAHEV